MNEELKKTSVANLMKMWVDMMRPHMQHTIDDNCKQWNPSQTYNKCIENIESVISQKLEMNLLETKVLLNYKKRTKDVKEAKYFKKKQALEVEKKRRKYFKKLNEDMGEIQNAVFNAHHAIVKLSPIVTDDDDDTI